jgi:hypothetical protein
MAQEASERSPLLGSQNESINGHAVDPENHTTQSEGADEVVLAEAPSTQKLALTLGAVWIGVFFAALGNYYQTLHHL